MLCTVRAAYETAGDVHESFVGAGHGCLLRGLVGCGCAGCEDGVYQPDQRCAERDQPGHDGPSDISLLLAAMVEGHPAHARALPLGVEGPELRARGERVGDNDLWIAATALAHKYQFTDHF